MYNQPDVVSATNKPTAMPEAAEAAMRAVAEVPVGLPSVVLKMTTSFTK